VATPRRPFVVYPWVPRAPLGEEQPALPQKSHIPLGQLFSSPFPIPPVLTTVILKLPRPDGGGGVGFEIKSKRQEDAELILLSEASGRFSVSIPGAIFPGPRVNKAIRYGSLSVAPRTRRPPLPPPQALSTPSAPAGMAQGLPGTRLRAGATAERRRARKAPAGAGVESATAPSLRRAARRGSGGRWQN